MWSHWKRKHQEEQWILDPNILLARSGRPLIFRGGSEEFNAPSNATQFEKQWWSTRKSIYGAVLEAIARGWQVPLEKLIKSYNQYTAQPESEERIVGTFGDQVYKYHVSPIRRP